MLTFTFVYENGNTIRLSDTVSYDSLPREGIVACHVHKDGKLFFVQHYEEGQIPIQRRRVEPPNNKHPNNPLVVYLLGWRNGREQAINYFFENDDVIHAAGKFRNEEGYFESWFYAPTIREFEKTEQEKQVSEISQ